jgi:SAM-dependent methyltransferase
MSQMSEQGLEEFTVDYYEQQLLKGMENFHPGGTDYTDRLAREVGISAGSRVLDVASGSGETALYLALKYQAAVTGADLSEKMVAHAKERAGQLKLAHRVDFRKAHVQQLPFPDDSFDASIAECSLCLFGDKVGAVASMARVVRPGGKVAISDVTLKGELPDELRTPLLYACCLASAQPLQTYVDIFEDAGLQEVRGYELTADITGPWREELPVLYDEVMNAFRDAIRLGLYEAVDDAELDRRAEKLLREQFGYAIVSGVVGGR